MYKSILPMSFLKSLPTLADLNDEWILPQNLVGYEN